MKKLLLILTVLISFITMFSSSVSAQGMMGNWNWTSSPSSTVSDDHTAREEAEGKEIWKKLQSKQVGCKNLTDENYGSLGEYFMGQMLAQSGVEGAGGSHEAMNNMMVRMMGEEGEKQMHVAMGKRNSGCDTSFMPMMGSGFSNMMGGWGGLGILGWASMLLFWILLILGVVALFRYLGGSGKRSNEKKSPLDILKERYARGEIDKKEFEDMKKDLR